ncbi:MAG: DUF2911 domain-containing protein [Bacteroidota bacterium]
MKTNILSAVFILLLSFTAFAQTPESKPSPAATATGKIGEANITIEYSSPAVKGRKIWGDLVPYNQVWRAGANEATIFTTDKDISVEGNKLPAGKYSLFAIPAEAEWTIIFNKVAKQWGAYKYTDKEDALRVRVKPREAKEQKERLAYTIDPKKGFTLSWDKLDVLVLVSK